MENGLALFTGFIKYTAAVVSAPTARGNERSLMKV